MSRENLKQNLENAKQALIKAMNERPTARAGKIRALQIRWKDARAELIEFERSH